MVITGAIQDIIIHIIPTAEDITTVVIAMDIHTGMGFRIDIGIIIDTDIIMAGIIIGVNLWNLAQRTFILVYGHNKE